MIRCGTVLSSTSATSAAKDKTLLDELKKALNILKMQQPDIDLWERGLILPGMDSKQEISTHINQAHLILLLLSPDFLASKQCREEMELAAKKRDLGETYVIPILLRHVAWEDTAIGKLEPLPKDGRPISGRPMCSLTYKFAKRGRYASEEENGEDMCQSDT
jgi:TIR domain-containing protein